MIMNSITLERLKEKIALLGDIIIENEVYFCELDSVAGDGDFGMSLSKGFRQLKAEYEEIDSSSISSFLRGCSMVITEHCGGASGPIWGSGFRGMAKATKNCDVINIAVLCDMFQAAVAAIQKRGNAQLGDKTLLDALIPATNSLIKSSVSEIDFKEAFRLAAEEAVKGAEKTKEYSAQRGRASYAGDRSKGHPDAGAVAIGLLLTKIA